MSLVLYSHPLASFCHKVLIALYENATPFEARSVDLSDEKSSAELQAYWPVGKIPVLRDQTRERTIPETSIILEYLDEYHPGKIQLIPRDPELRLEMRLWDRFFDCYVQVPMQKVVADRLRPSEQRDAYGVQEAKAALKTAYDMLDRHIGDRMWAIGDSFSMADCAAAPALFYAQTIVSFEKHPHVAAYFDRLASRPSFARVIDEARPHFVNYPLRDSLPERFLTK
jgi:glutathione S-transferase